MDDPRLAKNLDGLIIDLAEITLPAFADRDSYWADYEALARDGIAQVTVRPEIRGRRIGDTPYLDILCHFDPDALPDSYGIVYGDGQFQRGISAHLREVLRLEEEVGDIGYTEAGMQGDDYISLEGGTAWIARLADLSAHEVTRLAKSPDILSFAWRGQELKTRA